MADYMKPLVLVYQELRNVSATLPNPTLPGIVVGPCYDVVTMSEDNTAADAAPYSYLNAVTFQVPNPNQLPGRILTKDDIKIVLGDVKLLVANGTCSIATVSAVTTASVGSATCDMLKTRPNGGVGSKLICEGVTYTISNVNTATVTLTVMVDAAITDKSYNIIESWEGVHTVDVTKYTYSASTGVTLSAGIAVDWLPVSSATIYVPHRALRTDVTTRPIDISTFRDIELTLGKIVPENPLAYAANIMYQNAQTAISALGVSSDDSIGYNLAADILTEREVYAIALLTDDATIIASYKNHCEALSEPAINKFRMCIGNHKLPAQVDVASGSMCESIADTGGAITILVDPDATFLSDGVAPGDELTTTVGTHIVDSVINENSLKVMPSSVFPSATTLGAYSIVRTLSKRQQAEAVAANSKALGSKRCVMTYPNEILQNSGETTLPGYYLNAVLAGMICGLPSQAGLTNKGIAGVEDLNNSNFSFTSAQLDIMAAGGTCIFVQQTEESPPYIRHQLTTDMSLLETKEISVVKNNDFVSIFFRDIVKKYIGTWNVTVELLGIMQQSIAAGIQFLVMNKRPRIGAPIISANIELLKVSEISADRVELFINTTQPRPLNNIGLHMII